MDLSFLAPSTTSCPLLSFLILNFSHVLTEHKSYRLTHISCHDADAQQINCPNEVKVSHA